MARFEASPVIALVSPPRAFLSTAALTPQSHLPDAVNRAAYASKRLELDLDDFIGLAAAGCRYLDDVLLALTEQGARDRRGDRDLALLHVGFDLADDAVFHLLVGVLIHQRYGRTEHDLVAFEL